MCGIIGYTGKDSALTPVIEGLRRLEYRGYDSAGIAIPVEIGKPLFVEKRSGKLKNLEDEGAGEIILTSIDKEGLRNGFDTIAFYFYFPL